MNADGIHENAHIAPLAGERPTQYAERVGKGYAEASIQKDKKHKGQFFTPLAISAFMGGLATRQERRTYPSSILVAALPFFPAH